MSTRQRPRYRTNNNRTSIVPSLSTTVNTDTAPLFLPSIEESLQDWLSRSIPPESPSLSLDMCRCCGHNDCEYFETISSTMRKLESDARLAAVIGQSLLQKHEQYVTESNEIKHELEQKVESLQDKIRELEQSLTESEYLKQEYLEEKTKLIWECQRTQKSLEETTADLDQSNSRCLQLGSELKSKIGEIEKLRVFKLMARQADVREETLRTKLEDLKQELAVSRKAELTLENKHKKLKAKYESMCASFEKLKTDQKAMGMADDHQIDLVWLRESNEKLRKDVLKLTYALLSPNAAADLQITNSNQNHLIELIKELASANNKLKTDLLDCSDLLMECRSDLHRQDQEEMDEEDGQLKKTLFNHINNKDDAAYLSTSAPQSNEETVPRLRRTESKRSKKKDETVQPNEALKNNPVIHHHYHYYMKNKIMAEKGKLNTKKSFTDEATISPSSSSSSTKVIDSSSPFRQLYHQVTIVLQRLQQTDIRALNRRLRRAFDIFELSSMSNSIIENIVTDIDSLKSQFSWIEDKSVVKQERWIQDISMIEFFPIMGLVQEMLKEIGQLRSTMNDLQVEYVKKIEESDVRPFTWFTSIFGRRHQELDKRKVQLSQSQDSLHARFLAAANASDISIHSGPIHPLSKPNTTTITIRRKKSDLLDRHASNRSPAMAIGGCHEKKPRRSTVNFAPSSPTGKPAFPILLRASQSAGTSRKSQPALDYVVKRKRSTLGLNSSTDYDLSSDLSNTFTTSWLGNK
ncbi:hypothetical protein CU098_009115 [Rhizopus stolonifer]|uniref:Uncharacterized protein n=1 Tax=Rhizopus stolonifer TaxID=4846 RepID=A0A367KV14_RHIST|nr:hypothetical protein CU098_009115 [Rhizopus stolonifer]